MAMMSTNVVHYGGFSVECYKFVVTACDEVCKQYMLANDVALQMMKQHFNYLPVLGITWPLLQLMRYKYNTNVRHFRIFTVELKSTRIDLAATGS
eukprot:scaffold114504_cov37-Prasinocladus_malaysianus.AAC.1